MTKEHGLACYINTELLFYLMLWLVALCYYILAMRMAEITSIPPFDPFEQTGSVGPRWDRWKTRLQYYIDARGITVDNRKRVLLLHLAGPAVQDIFATLSDTGTSYMEVLTALNTYFTPQKSLRFERHTFRQAYEAPNESISQYETRLRRLGEHCDFDKYSLRTS